MTAADAVASAELFANVIRYQERTFSENTHSGSAYARSLFTQAVRQAFTDGQADVVGLPPAPRRQLTRELVFISQDIVVKRLWEQHRIVYDVDETLWVELGDTEPDTVIPAGLMDHLPHPDPYIALPHPLLIPFKDGDKDLVQRMSGFFVVGRGKGELGTSIQVSTHSPAHTGDLGLLICATVEEPDGTPVMAAPGIPDTVLNRVTLDLAKGESTVGQLIAQIAPRFDSYNQRGGGFEILPRMINACVSALIYLCAVNAELRPYVASPNARKAKGKRASKAPATVIQVGYRTGAALRAYRRAEAAERTSQPTGRKARPHIRRAHFHTYRVGAGRVDSIVKWLPPIPINVVQEASKPTVVRVKRS